MWEARGLPLGEIGASPLTFARLRCLPLKGGNIHCGPLILVIRILGLHIDLDQLENEARL